MKNEGGVYMFYKKGDIISYGRSGYGENKLCTFDELPTKFKEKLAVLMTYPGSGDSDEGGEGDMYWGYVDGDD